MSTLGWLVATVLVAAGIETPVANFELQDYRGKKVALDDYKDKPVVILAFLGTECPLAKLYAPKLQALADKHAAKGVAVIGIDANCQDSLIEIGGFVRQQNLSFPLLKDAGNVVADRLGAERTPEVFVLDKARVVRYRGRIDDPYGLGNSSGYARYKTRHHYLEDALTDLLDGKPVRVAKNDAVGCLIGRVAPSSPTGEITYAAHVAKILNERCVSCHRPGEVAPFSLTSYEEAVGWAEMMKEVIDEGRMPPWFADPSHGKFSNDARLSANEKKTIAQWIAGGKPMGDKSQLPPAPTFTEGWRIGEPDLVLAMRDKPYSVPAEGVVQYQYMMVDPGFTEDKWIQAAEARPGNRQVVHHIIVFVVPKEGLLAMRGRRGGGGGPGSRLSGNMLATYAPGSTANVMAPGTALFVPAGSRLVFQMHYSPNGTAQTDRSQLGLKFADPKTVKHKVIGGAVSQRNLKIPPHDPNHKVVASRELDRDVTLISLSPHMHLRGKAFKYEAEYPDGRKEILLDVPRYDSNWQLTYDLAEPKKLPAGTVIRCEAHYDNSEGNLANPDPSDTVRWGPQTWHEMMIGFFKAIGEKDSNQSLGGDAVESGGN